jgi:hypothetical protein
LKERTIRMATSLRNITAYPNDAKTAHQNFPLSHQSRPSEVAGRVTKDGVAPLPVDGAKIG